MDETGRQHPDYSASEAVDREPVRGVVAGTVLAAARSSAGLSEEGLAAVVGAEVATVRGWEDGSHPLAFAPYPEVEQLEAALCAGGSDPLLVADLDTAIWCDLVLFALGGDEDMTYLLADPVACEDGFRELLAWCLNGRAPSRYRTYVAPSGPLFIASHATLAAGVVQLLVLVHRLVRPAEPG